MLNRPRPIVMQALGGLIALVIMVPIAIYVVNSVFLSNTTPVAATRYSVPSALGTNANASSGGAGPSTSGSSSAKTMTIKMQAGKATAGFVFAPANLTVDAGTTIKWVDANTVPHNIVGEGSAAAIINRQAVNTDSYSVTFRKPGTYHYQCLVHPGMVGVVTVKAASSSAGSGSSGSTSSSASGANPTVKEQPGKAAAGFVFAPASLTVKTGTTVKWVDANTVPHNIVGQGSASSIINRPAINTDSYSVTFSKPGTYHYQCIIHPGMVGVVTVQ